MAMLSKYCLVPLYARFRSKMGGIRKIPDAAVERIELAPADENPTQPAISLPNEFERVRGVVPSSTLERERVYLTATSLKHGPTLAYRLDDAILADHTCYWWGGHEVSRAGGKRAFLTGSFEEYWEGQLCTYAPSNIYFGHWLRDAMAMELLAEQRGLLPLSYAGKPWMHEPGYRQMMRLRGVSVSFAHVQRLWVINDLGLNANWISRFKELRARIRSSTEHTGPSHIFLVRGQSGAARELLNAPEIMDVLANRGFKVIAPELLSPQEIARSLASAKVVVSVEGSALNHAQFAVPEKAGILVIQPPDQFNAFHKILMDFNGIRFSYVVADPALGGFTLAPERLLRTLDLVEAAIG